MLLLVDFIVLNVASKFYPLQINFYEAKTSVQETDLQKLFVV